MRSGNEFPRVRTSDWGNEKYDVFYSNGLGAMSPDRVYRSKISTLERQVWHEVGYYNSEMAVIDSPDGESCVLFLVCTPFEVTEETPTAFLVVLDGENLQELDRAYFPEEIEIPWLAHTTWISDVLENPTTTTTTTTTTSTTTTSTTTTDGPNTEPGSSANRLFGTIAIILCLILIK